MQNFTYTVIVPHPIGNYRYKIIFFAELSEITKRISLNSTLLTADRIKTDRSDSGFEKVLFGYKRFSNFYKTENKT